jgi:succinate dehydrogenase/fumarate reductase flavoprotein subunit
MQRHADVAVVGAGMAGLTASVRASEAGADVLVVEKAPRPGGSMYLSGGIVWTPESVDAVRERVPDGNEALQRLVVDRLPDGFDWLDDHDVRLREPESDYSDLAAQIDPVAFTERMVDHLEAAGGDLALETPLERLRTDEDGRVVGIEVRTGPRKTVAVEADRTILATGGFQGDPDLIQQFVTDRTERLWLRSNPWSTGDGLRAARDVGGALTDGMGTFYGHTLPAPPAEFDLSELVEATQYYGPWAIALDEGGRRFVDESRSAIEEHLAQAVAKRAEGRAYYVLDTDLYESRTSTGKPIRHIVDEAAAVGGRVATEPTLDALCDRLGDWGVHAANARETIEQFNEHVRAGTADRLDPPRDRHRRVMDEPPFYGVEVAPGITFTMGGLDVTGDMQVVRRSASTSTVSHFPADARAATTAPIEGLYAAGVDVGNVNHRFYMGGLSLALVSGLIAGEHAAAAGRVKD